ncbi:MAG TPA: hypothetical protein VI357_18740 [Mycobacteriales bacterium]
MRALTGVEELLRSAAQAGDELDLRGADVREVRAEVIRDLLLESMDPRGLKLRGAVVLGTLDLDGLRTQARLRLRDSRLPQGITMRGAALSLLDLGGCTMTGLLADDVTVEGTVLLRRGVAVTGLVSFAGARIGGKLDLADARLSGGSGAALVADRATIGSDLLLDDTEVTGGHPDGALQLTGTRVAGRLSARRIRAANPRGPAVSAANLQVTDTVDLSQGSAIRGVGDRGAVRLVGARLGSLSLGGARIDNSSGWALAAHYLDVSGTVYLDAVRATGGIRLSGSRIGGQVMVAGAEVDGGPGPALAGTRLHVAQAVLLDDAVFTSTGDRPTVDLRSARIAGDLELRRTRLTHPTGTALRLNSATVEGEAMLQGTVVEQGDLELDGLTYRGLPGRQEVTAPERLDWLRRMPTYAAQPYRQLAAAYQAAGHEDDARQVLVAQQRRLDGTLSGWTRTRHRLFGLTLQYGYQPLRAVALLAGVLLAAIVLFGALGGGTRTEAGRPCPMVDRVGLAIDAAVPLVSTGADDRCKLATGTGPGQALAAAGWVLTLVGWASATLVVAGYSGLVRRR